MALWDDFLESIEGRSINSMIWGDTYIFSKKFRLIRPEVVVFGEVIIQSVTLDFHSVFVRANMYHRVTFSFLFFLP